MPSLAFSPHDQNGVLYCQEGGITSLHRVHARPREQPALRTCERELTLLPHLQPQPSLASLPQLAADLLIHTLKLELVGYLGLQDFIPAVSGLDSSSDAKPEEGICFGAEGT